MTKDKKSLLVRLFIIIGAEFLAVALAVWFFDPFLQYHSPFLGIKMVLNDRDNQMAGSIRNVQHDSVLMGSSVAENFDSSFLDKTYMCDTLKIIRASGSVADLLYYLEMALDEHEIKNVFWCLDIFAMDASTEVSLYGEDIPRYLYTKSVLDDLPYIYNKEILLKTIPSMLAYSREGINIGGQAYNWSRGKEFSAAQAMSNYMRYGIGPETVLEQKDFSEDISRISKNISLVVNQVASHPEIEYRFLFPPYSMLWWDCAYVNGNLEERYYILEQTVPALLSFSNVEIYFFQNESSIVMNLDNYMDMVHYSPAINQYMLEKMQAGEYRVTEDNWEEIMGSLKEMVAHVTQEEIYKYYSIEEEER